MQPGGSPDPVPPSLTRRGAMLLFAVVVLAWGINWPVTKAMLWDVTPLWTVTIRSAAGAVALLVITLARGALVLPRRGDLPVVANIALLHMVGFSALVAIGLQFVPAGRAVVLGYTTPLWVAPAAWLLLGERLTAARVVGIALGLAGIAVMFNPAAFDWHDRDALIGNGAILLAAVSWAASIVHVRAHRWIATPFQLVFWEVLLATAVLAGLALALEGWPSIDWHPSLVLLFVYGGVFGIALAYWAMAMVNRSLPAITTSIGILATPLVGTLCSVLALGETAGAALLGGMALIAGGIALGTLAQRPQDGERRR